MHLTLEKSAYGGKAHLQNCVRALTMHFLLRKREPIQPRLMALKNDTNGTLSTQLRCIGGEIDTVKARFPMGEGKKV